MNQSTTHLTEDQKERIEKTLKRIRAGLWSEEERNNTTVFEEPSHIFVPETYDATTT